MLNEWVGWSGERTTGQMASPAEADPWQALPSDLAFLDPPSCKPPRGYCARCWGTRWPVFLPVPDGVWCGGAGVLGCGYQHLPAGSPPTSQVPVIARLPGCPAAPPCGHCGARHCTMVTQHPHSHRSLGGHQQAGPLLQPLRALPPAASLSACLSPGCRPSQDAHPGGSHWPAPRAVPPTVPT